MKVIKPVEVTDSTFVTSNVPENDYAVWSSGTTYASGNNVISGHRKYQSLQASNLNHDPSTSPTWWLDIGPTNRWACLDVYTSTQTVYASPVTYEINPGRINHVVFLNTTARSITVELVLPDTTVIFSQTNQILDSTAVLSWTDYFYSSVRLESQSVFKGLPEVSVAKLMITVENDTNSVYIGTVVFGSSAELGNIDYGAKAGINDYSKKETDSFGNVTLIQRGYSKLADVQLAIPTISLNSVQKILTDLRATPVLWIGADGYDSLVLYGFYRDFSIDLALPSVNYCSISIEGLV